VDSGSAVNLVISLGPEPVSVPNVVGLTQAAAESAVVSAGLVVGTVETAYSSSVPEGSVISQTPLSGTQVDSGTAVNLVISLGPEPVSVPNVVGLTQAAAESEIVAAGLTVGTVTRTESTTVPADQVISQSPLAFALVATGSPVDLVVSSGPRNTVIVSGIIRRASSSLGESGVVLNADSGQTTLSDESGAYELEVPVGFSGTLTPIKSGFAFLPTTRSYDSLTSSLFEEDYLAYVDAEECVGIDELGIVLADTVHVRGENVVRVPLFVERGALYSADSPFPAAIAFEVIYDSDVIEPVLVAGDSGELVPVVEGVDLLESWYGKDVSVSTIGLGGDRFEVVISGGFTGSDPRSTAITTFNNEIPPQPEDGTDQVNPFPVCQFLFRVLASTEGYSRIEFGNVSAATFLPSSIDGFQSCGANLEYNSTPGIPGDINGDGQVNAVDVQLVINAALGIDIGGMNADINGDGQVNAVDVQLVINAALGIEINL